MSDELLAIEILVKHKGQFNDYPSAVRALKDVEHISKTGSPLELSIWVK